MLRVLPPKNILNVYLYLEQLLLRDNCEPIEQLLHNKQQRERETTQQRQSNHERALGGKGTTQDKGVSSVTVEVSLAR